jgi:hypothetical protein
MVWKSLRNVWVSVVLSLFFLPILCAKEKLFSPELQAHPLLAKRIESWIAQLGGSESEPYMIKLLRTGRIAEPYLLKALESDNPRIKRQVIILLSRLKLQNCVPVLIKLLANEKEEARVREAAASALSMLPSEEVLKTLSKYAFEHDARIHRAAAYSLCRIQVSKAIPYLILLLKHWDDTIRHRAHSILVKITPRNIPADFAAWQKWWSDYKDIFEETK